MKLYNKNDLVYCVNVDPLPSEPFLKLILPVLYERAGGQYQSPANDWLTPGWALLQEGPDDPDGL